MLVLKPSCVLLQVYHVSYVILKTGPSPRPAAWVLERSVDDVDGEVGDGAFTPWQYYAPTDEDCWGRYGVAATPGDPAKAVLQHDDQVICTSFHSKAYPAEDAAVSPPNVQPPPTHTRLRYCVTPALLLSAGPHVAGEGPARGQLVLGLAAGLPGGAPGAPALPEAVPSAQRRPAPRLLLHQAPVHRGAVRVQRPRQQVHQPG